MRKTAASLPFAARTRAPSDPQRSASDSLYGTPSRSTLSTWPRGQAPRIRGRREERDFNGLDTVAHCPNERLDAPRARPRSAAPR